MSMATEDTRTMVLEREIGAPPERVWRALTTPHLLAEWLMPNDFALAPEHRFRFTADWGSVDCQVIDIDPPKTLSYSWAAMGLDSVVRFELTPADGGTHLRVEQSGFRADQNQAFHGARYGWTNFLNQLDTLVKKD